MPEREVKGGYDYKNRSQGRLCWDDIWTNIWNGESSMSLRRGPSSRRARAKASVERLPGVFRNDQGGQQTKTKGGFLRRRYFKLILKNLFFCWLKGPAVPGSESRLSVSLLSTYSARTDTPTLPTRSRGPLITYWAILSGKFRRYCLESQIQIVFFTGLSSSPDKYTVCQNKIKG